MKRKYFFSFFIFLAFFVVPFGFARAENIDPQNAGHKYAKFLEDDSQISFDCDQCGVTVTSSEVTGHAWSENYGWINLQPDNSGVVNDGQGNLSGYAWGETTGWINFNPDQGGVSISSGEFDGHAWSENYGWIQFDCGVAGACVKTSWAVSSGGGNTSGSSGSSSVNNVNNPPPPPPPIPGCINPTASNYNPSATVNDNSCLFVVTENNQAPTDQQNNTEDGEGGLGDFILDLFTPGQNENPETPENTPGEENPNEQENDADSGGGAGAGGSDGASGEGNVGAGLSQQFGDQINNALENMPTITRETVTVVSIVTMAVSTATIPLRKLADAPSRAIQLFSSAFVRRRKNWGVVFDAITKQPLDPVVVVIKDVAGKVIQTSITDMEGRFGFIVPPGMYSIEANKADYTFPSKRFEGLSTDVVYDDVYLGGAFEVSDQGTIVTKNVPLDPLNFNWNEFEKKRMGVGIASLRKQKISGIMFFIGFASSIGAIFLVPTTINYIVLGLYVVFAILKIFGFPKHSGRIKTRSGKPLAYGVMHVFSTALNKEVKKVVLDDLGNYYCLIRNGRYYITLEARNADNTYSPVYTSDSFTVNGGAIKKDFII